VLQGLCFFLLLQAFFLLPGLARLPFVFASYLSALSVLRGSVCTLIPVDVGSSLQP
jgi:hypothetical protein